MVWLDDPLAFARRLGPFWTRFSADLTASIGLSRPATAAAVAIGRSSTDLSVLAPQPGLRPTRLAVAVSGGVDSVALAVLLKLYSVLNRAVIDICIHAYTVDHAMRPESAREAAAVTNVLLNQIGVSAHSVLQLTWSPSDLARLDSAPETLARRARYSALIRAMHSDGIDTLAVAHTADDNIETFFMNLLRRRSSSCLRVIPRSGAAVPCAQETFPLGGNLRLIRPLLSCPKDFSYDVCRAANVTWFDDPTNRDPSFTLRNAVRVLIAHQDQLPQALRLSSIETVLHTVSVRRKFVRTECRSILQTLVKSGELKYDTGTGSVTWKIDNPRYLNADSDVMISLIKTIVGIVSATDSKDIPSWKVIRFLRTLLAGNNRPLTFGGVLFNPIDGLSWSLSRQPFSSSSIPIGFITTNNESILWDHRFWISCTSKQLHQTLVIKPLSASDITYFKYKSLHRIRYRQFFEQVPAKVLSTLPVIYDPICAKSLAIPTIDAEFGSGEQYKVIPRNEILFSLFNDAN
ncbi:PP-loop family-domain-containing protein [Lipomyces oligophaga]|uniref:PP-loop family-domain-containing protein n=1 Tax=Lipomyces oligophaga TaxID=45792 RepID=UPI0034CFB143